MKNEKIEIRVERTPYYDGVNFYGIIRSDKKRSAIKEVVAQEIDEDDMFNPFLRLEDNDVQFLFDELWRCGFRPNDGTGSIGQLSATEKHLNDMRKIVSAKLGVNL